MFPRRTLEHFTHGIISAAKFSNNEQHSDADNPNSLLKISGLLELVDASSFEATKNLEWLN
jgi:hypothetical protein